MPVHTRRYIAYRASLTRRAQSLRRDATSPERKLWFEFLRDLPQKFTRQKPLGRYVVDFYCSRLQLAIELDGDSHYGDGAVKYDAERTTELEHRSVRVIRFTNAEVMQQFEAVCLEIQRAIERSR